MCGIAGYICPRRQDDAAEIVVRMSAAIAARGPDGEGLYTSPDGRVVLAHRRLAIIDPGPGGAQPMSTRDGALVITFNGEIYNYIELRRDLQAAGCKFAGNSDTEVVLQAYAAWGADGLSRLRGMFAFAVYDRDRGVVFAARDRVGIKPFYFARNAAGFAFASSADALRAGFDYGSDRIDRRAVAAFLHHQFIPAPLSIWDGVEKLMPGTWLEFALDTGRMRTGVYWDLRAIAANAATARKPVDCGEMKERIAQCVGLHMRSDVPLGLLLSGGLDSGVLAQIAGAAAPGMPAFTLHFGEDRSEAPLARQLAAKAGLAHHEIELAQSDLADAPGLLAQTYGEPLADSSALPVYRLSEQVAKNVKVVLGGDGGDELFFGYKWYMAAQRMRAMPGLGLMPRAMRNVLAARMGGRAGLALLAAAQSGRARLDTLHGYLYSPDDLDRAVGGYGAPEFIDWPDDLPDDVAMRVYDLTGFTPDSILHKVDAASMAHGLEVRVPFLDHELLEYALGLDQASLFHAGRGKVALRKTYGADLPPDVLAGTKSGFSLPLAKWRDGVAQAARDCLPDGIAVQTGLLNADWVRQQLDRQSWRKESRLWLLLTLEKWLAARFGAAGTV